MIPATPLERNVRAVSHGLANRVLAIRCYAELASRASLRGDDPREDLAGLLTATETLASLLRELAAAANAAARGGMRERAALDDVVAARFSDELALKLEGAGS